MEILKPLKWVSHAVDASLWDHFIPVSESRNSIIVTPDFPKAVQPDYQFNNPLQINEIITYARTRFSPEIRLFKPDEWRGQSAPLAIASSVADPLYPDVEAFADRLWQDRKKVKLISFNGPVADYLTDDLKPDPCQK